jgi:hypothetical protein
LRRWQHFLFSAEAVCAVVPKRSQVLLPLNEYVDSILRGKSNRALSGEFCTPVNWRSLAEPDLSENNLLYHYVTFNIDNASVIRFRAVCRRRVIY